MSSIHILNNQRVRVGISVNPDPARRIPNIQLHGGSTVVSTEINTLTVTPRQSLINPFRTAVPCMVHALVLAPRTGVGCAMATVPEAWVDLAACGAQAYLFFVCARRGPRHGPFQWSHAPRYTDASPR